ncbi:MAG: thioredoxin family protein [Epsilonproteobacteria bacterium]|nr:thioredoxin family protein [Campylobacterota bacterium]
MVEHKIGVMLYFSGDDCGVCNALGPKIKELFDEEFPLIDQHFLNTKENIELASQLSVFSVPTLIVYLGGKEFIREGRSMSIAMLGEKMSRIYDILTSTK